MMLKPIVYATGFRPLALKENQTFEGEGEDLSSKLGTFYVCELCRTVFFIGSKDFLDICPVCIKL
jgi:hypothetical protein